ERLNPSSTSSTPAKPVFMRVSGLLLRCSRLRCSRPTEHLNRQYQAPPPRLPGSPSRNESAPTTDWARRIVAHEYPASFDSALITFTETGPSISKLLRKSAASASSDLL